MIKQPKAKIESTETKIVTEESLRQDAGNFEIVVDRGGTTCSYTIERRNECCYDTIIRHSIVRVNRIVICSDNPL